MKKLVALLAVFFLIAATPQETLSGLETNGYYIEDGSTATEQVVSDAVFDGRADGGRLYMVVLSEEPPGGATTFSDRTLDLLDGDGYVVTVAPETVGFAGDGTVWTANEMNSAVDASLSGSSDDDVVELFMGSLVGGPAPAGGDSASGGGIPILWILVIGAVVVGVWMFVSRRNKTKRAAGRMEQVRALAREKLDEVANDILEMEDEVSVSDNADVTEHYQRASAMYSRAIEDNQRATTVGEMLKVSEELDLAIWELDCAEALLDGKPKPEKPEPPNPEALQPPPAVPEGHGPPPQVRGTVDHFPRRPQRHSTGSNDMMTMLMAMLAMRGMSGGRRGGGFGGFGGGGRSMRGGGRIGGGGGRIGGGGGRIRGGGRRG